MYICLCVFSSSLALDMLHSLFSVVSLLCRSDKIKTVREAKVYECLFYKRKSYKWSKQKFRDQSKWWVFFLFNTVGMLQSLKRQQNQVFIVQIKKKSSELWEKLMSKINLTERRVCAEDELPWLQLLLGAGVLLRAVLFTAWASWRRWGAWTHRRSRQRNASPSACRPTASYRPRT